ncbi:MAG: PilN domain-containing protein [Bacillus sp. (in: Bacteria)]|nr:PilN domain-containing protein [Bacillus sp. (in: firmicutes)]
MLVEINLLPQKESKKTSFLFILSGLLVLIILLSVFYFWQTQSLKNENTSLDKQITMTKKITDKKNKQSETVESVSSVTQLKNAIVWANDYPIQTIPVMQHLTSLLPERGFIQSFGYTEAGTVTLTVQFDNAREAAYFLDSLNQSEWIEEASLSSLAATETETTASNTTGAPNNQNTTTDTKTTTTTTTTTTEGTTSDQNSQTNTKNTTTDNSTSTTSKYLPRYTGQFEINFNKDEIKRVLKESKANEEGVTGS